MPQIHVVFTASGDSIVLGDAVICARREPVTWCFHSDHPEIKSVEVEFTSEDFFKGATNPRKWTEPLVNGRADFYGHVPDYSGPLQLPKIAKYTVRGLDAGGNKRAEKDPVIITTEP
jgi:hypothetical protein